MELKWLRYSSQNRTTLSVLLIDEHFECYGLEDCYRPEKIAGETRIPSGRFELVLREYGGHYEKYTKKYEGHKGMLQLKDVPNFEHILIHIGNYAKDTKGCLLVGTTANNNVKSMGQIVNSTSAYLEMYFKVLPILEKGEKVFINIIDLDKPKNL
jgi:hypothetical protein